MAQQPTENSSKSSDYANPQLLVDTQWLADHLNDPNIRIVDCDVRDAYRRAHISGAVSPREHYMKGEGSPLIMASDQFAREMAEMGIGDNTLVVCYDHSASLYAARMWWCLRYYGHDQCVVVNGGWNKWLQEGRPATQAEPKPPRASFTPRVRESAVCTVGDLKDSIGKDGTVIWDVRSDGEWDGSNSRGNKRVGHVPGAVHSEYLNAMTKGAVPVFRPAAELREMLAAIGVTPEKEVVTY